VAEAAALEVAVHKQWLAELVEADHRLQHWQAEVLAFHILVDPAVILIVHRLG
jgi:hypothetical protein